jgi:hypothetical protein
MFFCGEHDANDDSGHGDDDIDIDDSDLDLSLINIATIYKHLAY